MTALKTVSTRRGRMRQHLDPQRPGDEAIFLAYVRAAHSGVWRARAAALYALVRALARRDQVGA
jgi:hypothetical protein